MDFISRYRIVIVWASVGAILLGIFGYAFVLAQRAGKVAFTLTVVPSTATVKMNDVSVSSGTYYLLPGKYTVIAQADGFSDYRKTIQVNESTDNTLAVPLIPVSAQAKEWVKANRQLYQNVADTGKTEAEQKTNLLKQQNPITGVLPLQTMIYTINYRADPSDQSRIILQITAGEGYKRSALQKIRELGYDPTNYKIEFMNYTNPFTS